MAYKKEEHQYWQKYGESGNYCSGQYYGYPASYPWGAHTRYWYDKKEGRYYFEIEMPGVSKKDVSLDMWGENFCVWAKKDESEYSGCYMFPHYVEPEKAQAWYEDGVLKIHAPLKDWEKRTHVAIQ